MVLKSGELEVEVTHHPCDGRTLSRPKPSMVATAWSFPLVSSLLTSLHSPFTLPSTALVISLGGRSESNRKLSSSMPTTPGMAQQLEQVGEGTEGGGH
jgi:hypothetical protein